MRANLTIAAVCVAVLLFGAAVYAFLFRDDEAPPVRLARTAPEEPRPAPSPAPPAPAPAFEVAEVEGVVEVRRGDAWMALARGERVEANAVIRTGDRGRATLKNPQGDELYLRERVVLEVGVLSQTVTELRLTRGKVRAQAAPGTERLQITSGGARAVGAGGTRFTVYADPRGAVAVATEDGEVKVLAAGREVTVGRAHKTYVAPGQPPTDPVAIPDEVFVSVAWPRGEVHATSVTLKGRTTPGTQVAVNGQPVEVEDDGSFTAQVPLPREGSNPVEVRAEPVAGAPRTETRAVQRDTRGPPLTADPDSLYQDPPQPRTPPQRRKPP